jgi:hypothetical protein
MLYCTCTLSSSKGTRAKLVPPSCPVCYAGTLQALLISCTATNRVQCCTPYAPDQRCRVRVSPFEVLQADQWVWWPHLGQFQKCRCARKRSLRTSSSVYAYSYRVVVQRTGMYFHVAAQLPTPGAVIWILEAKNKHTE